jgi:hypothetical protein
MLAVFGDHLHIQGTPGFGWQQQLGILIGTVLLVLAGVLRIDMLSVFALVILALSVFADLLGIGSSSGFGWKQEGVGAIALGWIWLGLYLRRRTARPGNLSTRITPELDARPSAPGAD